MTAAPDPIALAAEARRLAESATPGPWAWEATSQDCNQWCIGNTEPLHEGQVVEVFDEATGKYAEKPDVVDFVAQSGSMENFADAVFIAAARTLVPALADAVVALAGERDRWNAEHDAARRECRDTSRREHEAIAERDRLAAQLAESQAERRAVGEALHAEIARAGRLVDDVARLAARVADSAEEMRLAEAARDAWRKYGTAFDKYQAEINEGADEDALAGDRDAISDHWKAAQSADYYLDKHRAKVAALAPRTEAKHGS